MGDKGGKKDKNKHKKQMTKKNTQKDKQKKDKQQKGKSEQFNNKKPLKGFSRIQSAEMGMG